MKIQYIKFGERLKSAVIGAALTFALMVAVPVLARVAQETITIDYNNIRVAVNGRYVDIESEPFIFQGRTYLPVRDVAEAVGYNVTWEDATNTVHLTSRMAATAAPDYPPHQTQTDVAASTTPSAPSQASSSGSSSLGSSSSGNRSERPTNPTITREGAIEIARADLAARGLSGTLRSASMSWERNQWVWEVDFRNGRIEYEWYINVDTGNIVKFEIDR